MVNGAAGGVTTPAIERVTALVPTSDSGASVAQFPGLAMSSHCGVAWGLTVSPTGRSTRTLPIAPTGFFKSSSSVYLTVNWVKPTWGWAEASSKN